MRDTIAAMSYKGCYFYYPYCRYTISKLNMRSELYNMYYQYMYHYFPDVIVRTKSGFGVWIHSQCFTFHTPLQTLSPVNTTLAHPMFPTTRARIHFQPHMWIVFFSVVVLGITTRSFECVRGYTIEGFISMLLILVSCVESVVLSRVLKLHITTQYIVRRHSLRYGYMDHPFGSECPNILHRMS